MNFSVLAFAFFTLWACEGVEDTDFFASSSGGSAGSFAGAGAGGVSSGGSGTTTGGAGAVGGTSGGVGGTSSVGGTGGKDGAGGTTGGTGGSAGSDGAGATGGLGGDSFGGEGGAPELQGGAGGEGGEGACAQEEICDGLDNDCDGEVDPPGTCPAACKGFARKHDGHGYMVCKIGVDEDLTWSQAQERCVAESPRMHLAWIETAAENEFLRDVADELVENELWIGASDLDVEGAWFWQPGGVQFYNQPVVGPGMPMNGQQPQWDKGQPNNLTELEVTGEDCAVLMGNGKWNDYRCNITTVEGFICELD